MKKGDVIVALDMPTKGEICEFLSNFEDKSIYVKIGMEAYNSMGPEIIEIVKGRSHKLFLDLKLFDIPNTVERTMERLAYLGVDMINLHSLGGHLMMEAALRGLTNGAKANNLPLPQLLGVTILTSTSDEILHNDMFIKSSMEDTVVALAQNVKKSGLAGVVCSPMESKKIHECCGEDFLTVTPGIRFDDASKGDQVRVTTPAMARELGSNYIVVGRPITGAKDVVEAFNRCEKDFLGL